jgi:hypothetical protein
MPQFVSPGAMAGNAIQQFLMQREEENRQRMIAALLQKKQEEDTARQAAELELRKTTESRIAADADANRTALEQEREFRRAGTIAENAIPDDPTDAATADLLTRQGYGGQVRRTPGIQSRTLDMPVGPGVMMPGRDMGTSPEQLSMRGGSKYLNARATEEARAAQAAEAARARAEQAEDARASREAIAREGIASREAIAGMANAGRAETTGLRNDLLQTQVDNARQKQEEKAASDKRAKDAARVTSGATIDVIKQLADIDETTGIATLKPGTANLFGMRNPLAQLRPGGDTSTAKAALERLKGRVIVDLLNEMKNQSRTGATGFGALSGPELTLLENAASQLNSPNISDTRAAEELSRIYDMAKRLYGDDSAPSGRGGVRILSVERVD